MTMERIHESSKLGLTVRTGEIPKLNAVYEAFKNHTRDTRPQATGDDDHVETLISTIREYSSYFCAMALDKETDPELRRAFHDLRELKVDVAYPFLLELYRDYATKTLSKIEFVNIVRWVEAYVFRRAVCAIPTNSMNKTFATFTKALKKDRYEESIAAHFLLLPSYRRFPGNDEFERDIQTRDLYNFRSRSYWLRRFENYGRKEIVTTDEYTVEHILPQNENLGDEWRAALGEDWQRVQQTWLQTLGNLTLTAYNSEYSDHPFAKKRDMEGGFAQSPLRVNKGLGQVNVWKESTIKDRAQRLAKHAVQVWGSPALDDETLAAYHPKKSASPRYSLEDHPHLQAPGTAELFAALRKEVLALDPCVNEEILKLYVVYKAETNFVDVVPLAKRLRLSLNMAFAQVVDPKGRCKNVTALGRWGNGDVEVMLSSLDELPYIVGLVRQSLEQQLGDGARE